MPPTPIEPPVPAQEPPSGEPPRQEPPAPLEDKEPPVRDPRVPGQPSRKDAE